MKKILSFLLGAVLAFGLVSCDNLSDDLNLHDAQPAPLGLMGIDTGICVPFEFENGDNSVQTLKFKWSADATVTNIKGDQPKVQEGWGKSSRLQFKIILPSGIKADGTPDWNKDRAGDDNPIYLTLNSKEPLKLLSREESGAGDPAHVYVEGLVDGAEYTLIAYYDSTKESVSVICTGEASDPAQFRVEDASVEKNSKNFPAKVEVLDENKEPVKDADGKIVYENKTYAMSKSGDSYVYEFIAKETEDISIQVKNDLIGTDKSKDFNFEKDHAYKLTYTPPKIGSYGKFECTELDSIFEKGVTLPKPAILANYDVSYDFYTKITSNNGLTFKPTSTTMKFKILRNSSEYPYWGKGSTAFKLEEAYEPTYCRSADETTKPDYIEVTGLEIGKPYRLQVKENKKDPAEMTFTIKKVSETYKWFWMNVPVDAAATVIFNENGSGNTYQTGNMANLFNATAKSTIVYEWCADGSGEDAVKSERTDYPSDKLTAEDGMIRLFVYANVDQVAVYTFNPELFGGWPGKRMCSDDYDPNNLPKATIKSIEFKNFSGTKLYALDGNLPGNAWNGSTPNVVNLTGGSGTLTINGELVIDSPWGFQIVLDPASESKFWDAKIWDGGEVKCGAPTETGDYKLVADGSAKTLTLVKL